MVRNPGRTDRRTRQWQLQELRQNINHTHKRHPIPPLTGKLWGVFCDCLWENWPRYNGSALYNSSPTSQINTLKHGKNGCHFANNIFKFSWMQTTVFWCSYHFGPEHGGCEFKSLPWRWHILCPIRSRMRNKCQNLWVRWCVCSWWPHLSAGSETQFWFRNSM